MSALDTPYILPDGLRPRKPFMPSWQARLPAALADAVAWILLLDVLLSLLLPGHGSIAFIFFYLPAWVPAAPLIPAAIAAYYLTVR